MEEMNEYRNLWKKRYRRILNQRLAMWKELSDSDIDPKWLIRRPNPNQWAIDEIARHMLASEIRYIHQSFDPSISQLNEAVAAQWVKNRFFRLKEDKHVELDKLKNLSASIEAKTVQMIDAPNVNYEKNVRAPWGEEMKVFELLEAFYDHEQYHRGQIYQLLTFFRGIPEKIKSQI